MRTTRYFEEQVLGERSYIRREWRERILANPLRREVQPDGRIRHWGLMPELAAGFSALSRWRAVRRCSTL